MTELGDISRVESGAACGDDDEMIDDFDGDSAAGPPQGDPAYMHEMKGDWSGLLGDSSLAPGLSNTLPVWRESSCCCC